MVNVNVNKVGWLEYVVNVGKVMIILVVNQMLSPFPFGVSQLFWCVWILVSNYVHALDVLTYELYESFCKYKL